MSESKQAICSALHDLTTRQPLSSISIDGVCRHAGLSRKTFSRNFSTLQDVIQHQMFLDFIKPMNDLHLIMKNTPPIDTVTLFERNLRILSENKDYYNQVAEVYGSLWFADQMAQLSLRMDFNPYANFNLSPIELDFVKNLYAGSMAMVFRWWLDHGMQIPEREVAQMACDWLYAHPLELNRKLS